jgi:hypothetical protein
MNDASVPHPDLGRSIEIMRKAHEGQLDKSARPCDDEIAGTIVRGDL